MLFVSSIQLRDIYRKKGWIQPWNHQNRQNGWLSFVLGFALGANFNKNGQGCEAGNENGTDIYGLTVYVGNEDISQEIRQLWENANRIYDVDDTEIFEMGEAVSLFDDAPEYYELKNYDLEADAVFTKHGKAQLEQAKIGGPYELIQKREGKVYRMGPWKTGYSYADALEGIRVKELCG